MYTYNYIYIQIYVSLLSGISKEVIRMEFQSGKHYNTSMQIWKQKLKQFDIQQHLKITSYISFLIGSVSIILMFIIYLNL